MPLHTDELTCTHYTGKQRSSLLFLLPSLGCLTASCADTRKTASHESAHHSTEPPRRHHPHHFSHLGVLIDHLIDFLNRRSTAARYSFPARTVQESVITTFLRSH